MIIGSIIGSIRSPTLNNMKSVQRQYTRSAILLLFTLLTLHSAKYSQAIRCVCNTCNEDYCDPAEHKESQCYKAVEKIRIDGSYNLSYSFGCFSGDDGSLAPLQCQIGRLRHVQPKFIACCNTGDYCNADLPDPSESEDPRWNLTGPPPEESDPASKSVNDPRIMLLIGFFVFGFFWVGIKLLYKLTSTVHRRYLSKIKADSHDSICSFKTELPKFNHSPNYTGSSQASTKSYSMSVDYLSHKPDPLNQEASCVSIDMTSGLGERMLNQRTIARAVGSGETSHVGTGRFGRVFRGVYHCDDVAVKAFRAIDQDSWNRENKIYEKLNHENIVRFIASETVSVDNSNTENWMFLEYCPYGSLCDFLDHNEILGPGQAIKMLYSIINGLMYLHEDFDQGADKYKKSIAHRDLKSKNILMKTPDTCCIADFGHALVNIREDVLDDGRCKPEELFPRDYRDIQVGTVRYMAPEILQPNFAALNYRSFYTYAQGDLYQFGLILWEVCHRTALDIAHQAGEHKLPYDGVVPMNPDISDMIKIVCEDQYRPPRSPNWEKHPIMKRLTTLMVECWRPKPQARMETLGVKKKLKELYDQTIPPQLHYLNNLRENELTPNFRTSDKDKTRSTDHTL